MYLKKRSLRVSNFFVSFIYIIIVPHGSVLNACFGMYWHGCLCGYSLKVVYIRASSSRSSSSAKSPMTRDSGCESSGSTNASPEFSPPSSSVSSDSVFPSVKDEQITKVYSVSQITVATDI